MNGFGGGGKILFPGVSNFDAILEHHLKYSFRDGSDLGLLQGNPFYEEVSELAETAGLDFIINSVLDHNDRLYDLVCGDPVEAHLAGIDICKGIISRAFPKKADLTVISAFPYEEGPQIMKPFAPASLITKKGGVIILVARCTFPLSDIYIEGCERFRLKYAGNLMDGVFGHFDKNRRIVEDGAPEFNMSIAQALLAQHDFKVILVSEEIPRDTAERIGFLYAEDLNRAFAMSAAFVADPEVHIVPSGGVILPVLEENRTS
jgi:nickel-dependent lactate racemase